jgi:multicomponent Na+:H+ antiporter subunit D
LFAARMPMLIIIFSLVIAFLMPIFARWKKEICGPIVTAVTGISFLFSLFLLALVFHKGDYRIYLGGFAPPWGIELHINHLAALMVALITGFCFLISVYSLAGLDREIPPQKVGWYYTAYLLLMTGMVGMMVTNDLFNMYVFLEIVGISSCAVVIAKGTKEATEATLKYLLLATLGSGFIVFAIGFLYTITGNLNIAFIAVELKEVAAGFPFVIWTSIGFLLVGFGLKAALFPLHVWLPDAHSSAPFPSSALLSGLVVKVYIIAYFKILYGVFGPEILAERNITGLLTGMAATAIVAGSIFAFTQKDLKRRLAYSTVSQVGYIFLGLSLGTPWGVKAALLHMVIHAFMKVCLFLAAGNIYFQTGKRNVTLFTGLGRVMPLTMACFTVASLSMVGIPAFAGFISKYGLAMGSIEAGKSGLVALVVLSGLLNAMYYFPIIWQSFFTGSRDEKAALERLPLLLTAPVFLLACGILFLGLFPGPLLKAIDGAVISAFFPQP